MSNKEADISERIKRVKEKVAAKNVFLNPPLTESEIEVFEKRHHISLPEPYREFLLQIGNGGQGPDFDGIVALEASVPAQDDRPDLPFLLIEYWESPIEDTEADEKKRHAAFYHGQLYLCTDGCDYDWVLIVTGEERENVWMRSSVGIAPCTHRIDFLRWYEYWLDVGDESFSSEQLTQL